MNPSRWSGLIAGLAVILALGTFGAAQARPTDGGPTVTVAQQRGIWFAWTFNRLRDCGSEDSSNCRWDAQRRGNHEGETFVNLNGRAYYEGGTSARVETKPRCDHYGQWRAVPDRLVGQRVDGVGGGSFRVTPRACWRPGPTTYIITPSGRVGTS